jgi:5-formyltetrahydrofolate cyclo-ligase
MENEKHSLRSLIRKGASPVYPGSSRDINEHLLKLESLRTARTVMAFHPLPGEVDLLPLMEMISGKCWVFPRVDGTDLTLHRWSPQSSWTKGAFGIREPDPLSWPHISPGEVDLALIPGLAFDRLGNRLGRGKGFYDRFLASQGFTGLKIGVGPLIDRVPVEPHDIRMDLVVSREGVCPTTGGDWTNPPKEDNAMGR